MADIPLSNIGITTDITGGFAYIILPNGVSPTGYDSFKISIPDLQAYLQGQITVNVNAISALGVRVTSQESIQAIQKYPSGSGPHQFAQPAKSNIFKIYAYGNGTIKLGTAIGLDDIMAAETVTSGQIRTMYEDFYTNTARTVHITLTGTIATDLYFTQNNF